MKEETDSDYHLLENQKPQKTQALPKQTQAKKKKKKNVYSWPIKCFIISLVLGAVFTLFSETVVIGTHFAISFLVVFVLLLISVVSDLFSMVIMNCDLAPFTAMSARKVKGAKICVAIIKRNETVCSVLSDVVGDICAIVSGAAGSGIAIALYYYSGSSNTYVAMAWMVAVSAIIGAITVSLKAVGKIVGGKYCNEMLLFLGKLLSFFVRNEYKRK